MVSGGGYLGSSLSNLIRKAKAGLPPFAGQWGTLKERFSWRGRSDVGLCRKQVKPMLENNR